MDRLTHEKESGRHRRRIALVGSANITSRAMGSNLECGILITGGCEPRAIRDHVMDLKWLGVLERTWS